jgi:hypothetical protein
VRPQSIVLFDRLFLASLVLALINAVLAYPTLVEEVEADPALAQIGGGPIVIGVVLASLLIPLVLWYFISRRASNIAKWLLVALVAIGLFFGNFSFSDGLTLPAVLGLVVTLLQVVAIVMLFRADARAWLEGDGAADR